MNESEEIMDRENTLAINLQGICKSFSVGKRKVEVLKKVDVSINSGEMTAIMGASGCGKSTLLNIIGCLDIADAGEYWLRGEKITGKSRKQMARIRNELFGYVIQDFALVREDTVLENVKIPLEYSKKKIDKNRVSKILEELGIAKLQKTRISLLSGGEQQMLAMGRALMSKPRLIVMDEPSMGLSPIFVNEIFDIIRVVSESGTTVLLVEQNAKKALEIADRAYVLETGKILLSGDAKELMNDDSVKKAYLSE